jgi:hypothetical protein
MSRADSPLRGRMIFNVGARRSGTFWLQRIVTAHPDVAAVPSETHLFSHGIAPLFERFQHSLRSSTGVGEVYVERDAALDAARDLCDVVFSGMLPPGASRMAERTPLHVLHLDLIAAIYPDARFVHIIRDGRDVALSIAAQEWGPREIEEAAAEWGDAVRTAREARLPADAYHEVRYEELLADPSTAASEIFDWLELPADGTVIAAAVAEAGIGANLGESGSGIGAAKWREAYSAADLDAFDRAAGNVLRELGYPDRDEPTGGVRRTRSPSRPMASIRSRLAERRRPRLGRGGEPTRGARLQEIVDRLIGALQDRAAEGLAPLLAPDAAVRIVERDGERQARGAPGRELLRQFLAEDQAFAGRQVRGDAYLGLPHAGVVLTYSDAGGRLAERLLFVRFSGERIAELVVYAL